MTLARLATNILRGPGAVFLCAAALALVPPEGASGEPSAGFVPGELVSIPATSDVLVLGTAPCAARSCVQLWRVSAGGHGLTPLAVPPGESASGPGLVEGAHLVFANVDDGYALTDTPSVGSPTRGLGGSRVG